MARILVVDDEPSVCHLLERVLENDGHTCRCSNNAEEARESLKTLDFELVLSDIRMPGESGLDFVHYVLNAYPDTAAVIISGVEERDVTESALKMGVYGYLIKPFTPNEVLVIVNNALLRRRLEMENRAHRDKLEQMVEERTAELSGVIHRLQEKEEELRGSEEKYRRLVDNLPGVVYTSHKDRSLLFVDEKIEELTCNNSHDLRSRKVKWSDIIHEDDIESKRKQFEEALHTTRSFVMDYRINRPVGDTIWVQDRGAIICDAEGKLQYVSGVLFDITEQKLAERALETEKERFRVLVEHFPVGVSLISRDGQYKYVNPEFVRLFGYTLDEIPTGIEWLRKAFPDPDYRNNVIEAWERDMGTTAFGKNVAATFKVRCKDGSEKLIFFDTVPIDDADLVVICSDITEQKLAEEALETEKERFRALVENFPVGVSLISRDGQYKYVNPEFVRLFGYTLEDVPTGIGWIKKTYPDSDYRKKIIEAWNKELRNTAIRKSVEGTSMVRCKDGSEKLIHFKRVHLDDTDLVVIYSDITEQKRTETELKAAHAEMEQLFASISSILIGIDSENRVTRWNRAAGEIFGLEGSEIIGKPFLEVPISWNRDQVMKGMIVCRGKGRPIRLDDIRFLQRNGKDGFLGITLNPIISENSESVGILILAADITARKLLESQLAQAQKLESIGQLAAGIAHEINTPTQYVGDNLRFLSGAFDDLLRLINVHRSLAQTFRQGMPIDERVRELEDITDEIGLDYLMEELPKSIAESLEGMERVAKIVLSMKEFSHPGTGEKSLADINKAIESTITVARNEWKYISEMVMDLDPSLPLVSCIPGELNQVILNIIINAAHAIKEQIGEDSDARGTITVATRRKDESCEIRISDTGPGIPEKIRDRIFDPFFTTKEVGKGTGQGLALSHTVIVEKHGGSISIETEMGKGTTFVVSLPIAEQIS